MTTSNITPQLLDLSDADIEAAKELYVPLANAVRRLVDASVTTTVDPDVIRAVTAELNAQADRLDTERIDGPLGVKWTTSGKRMAWGNAVVGRRNPIAPPVEFTAEPDGRVWADFELGAAYEGPHNLTHGGVSALILDQAMGAAAEVSGAPGMTGTLTLKYLRPTPLGALHVEARAVKVEGVKTFVEAFIGTADGPTIEAHGVFILPAAVRALYEEHAELLGYDPTSYPES